MEGLLGLLDEIIDYPDILSSIRENNSPIMITGISGSQKAHLASCITKELHKPSIFVVSNELLAKRVYEDLKLFWGDKALYYPAKELVLYGIEAEGQTITSDRMNAIHKSLSTNQYILVVSVEALAHKVIPAEIFKENSKKLKIEENHNINNLSEYLVSVGYQSSYLVEGKGQFSIRGGILDIFPINEETPFRIDFFDDVIDSIKTFEISSQLSIAHQNEITIIPAREGILDKQNIKAGTEKILKDLEDFKQKTKDPKHYEKLHKVIMNEVEKINNGIFFPGIEKYISYLYRAVSLFEYLPKDAVVFVDEFNNIEKDLQSNFINFGNELKNIIERGNILPQCINCILQPEEIIENIENKKVVHINTFLQKASHLIPTKIFNIPSRPTPSFNGKMELLIEDIKKWKKDKYKIIILAGSKIRVEGLSKFLEDNQIEHSVKTGLQKHLNPGEVVIMQGALEKGFEYSSIKLVIISDKEFLGDEKRKRHKKSLGQKIKAFTDLNIGDYVVHQAHGIGQYVGIEKLKVEGVIKDYFKIKYLQGNLFVPISQLDLIQKYIGSEGKAPRVNRLGGTDWNKTKLRVKESVQDLAKGLIDLYAQRQTLCGHSFSKDNIWQRQFEETFPYEETEGQLQSIEEVKKDMENQKPMDRLLCGDVGYGKTEVAIRAAFKTVMDGKQVAYLVPTTILAGQHYNTFASRMRNFPVTVEMLSRFKSPAEQKKIVKGLKDGLIDIIIGTHRLLQKDISFKDLGLVIVDEEQRFGVTHKEQLKELKTNVDVLTLTATPIPRTLQMALVGVRDMSIIDQPPQERVPVQTYVLEHDYDLIRDAIIKEVNRGGQVFYLHNRVSSIQKVAVTIQNLVPEAKVVYAHGQMSESQLENIVSEFINGRYDVLVCTTIIESGIDMQNVNTIIIEDADKLGLAQLYQLRGRVGRARRQAYAYLTFHKDKTLSEEAQKRLKAIKEFTEFGSGFKIAMRDLEIRGAGNLIGPEQHGHMNSVGYEMYCKILNDTILELKGEKVKENFETSIDINVSAYIDDNYIKDTMQKITMYKKIAAIETEEDIADIKAELEDRYGDIPKEINNLIEVAFIKQLCIQLKISSLSQKLNNIILTFNNINDVDLKLIGEISNRFKKKILFTASTNPYITFKVDGIAKDELLPNIKILLQNFKNQH